MMQRLLSLLLALCTIRTTVVFGGGVPSADMLRATSLEEFEALRASGGAPVNATLRDEIYQEKQRQRQEQASSSSQPLLASAFNGVPGFYHGVASGDPLPDAVILWTRYTPVSATDVITLELRIAPVRLNDGLPLEEHLDPDANPEVRRALIEVSAASDWIAKIDVTGLPSGTKFVYGFAEAEGTGAVSEMGQTTTAPAADATDTAKLVYAVFSCSHFANGYFHAYDIASTILNLDFWIHVGDYFVRSFDGCCV